MSRGLGDVYKRQYFKSVSFSVSESSPPNVYWTNFYFFSGGFAVKVMLCYETKKSQSHEDFGSFYIFS